MNSWWTAFYGALAATIVASCFKVIRRGASWVYMSVKDRVVADDQTLLRSPQGWALTASTPSTSGLVRVVVAAGPALDLQRKEIDPDAAIAFARRHFPKQARGAPAFSAPNSGVRFDFGAGMTPCEYLWLWSHGRIDLSHEISPHTDDDGTLSVSIIDLLPPLLLVADAIKSKDYITVFGQRRFRRRRFNWFIAVSPTLVDASGNHVGWNTLTFPGRTPERASPDQRAFCPPQGFARKELHHWLVGGSHDDLVRIFLNSFLKENGFHAIEGAVDDVISALGTKATSK